MSKVLLIEDSPPLSRIIDWILSEAGHDVRVVTTPAACNEEARLSPPDIVVFNTGMPFEEKLEHIGCIRDAAPDARIVELQSSGSADAQRVSGIQTGGVVDGYLSVPFHADDLLNVVDQLTEGAA
jgi:DNA-binding response OmpR family regulator